MKATIAICYFSATIISAQSRFEKRIDVTGVTTFTIQLNQTNTLKLQTAIQTDLIVSTIAEGEYQNQVTLVSNHYDQENIRIRDVLQPVFEIYQDKLSAHKIYAITTTITLPKNKNIIVEMASGTMEVVGDYKRLFIKSNAANVAINSFTGNAKILSKTGIISADMNTTSFKTVTKSNKSTQIVTEEGSELLLETAIGKVIIIE